VNPDYLPALGRSLRALGEFAARHDVDDQTLAEVAAELDRARSLVAGARGQQRANSCLRHPGSPVDPAADNGCLLCGSSTRRPAAPVPDDLTPAEVLDFAREHGHEAATDRYGGRALARALAIGQRPKSPRRPIPAAPDNPQPEGQQP
jgi:hypothetical protein